MNRFIHKIAILPLLISSVLVFQSCSDDSEAVGTEQELTQTELQTILEVDDAASAADQALAELFAGSATTGKASSKTNECYSAEYSESGFVATFNNCVLNDTENVNGTLIVTYEVGNETAAFTAAYQDFFVGNLKLNGTRSYTLSTSMEQNGIFFNVTSNISVEFEDGDTITETGTKTFGFIIGKDLQDSLFSLSGSWTVTADGNTYVIESNSDLQGNFGCQYFTTGSMDVEKNGLVITVDFGDGTCDDKATLTYPNGATQEITL